MTDIIDILIQKLADKVSAGKMTAEQALRLLCELGV